MRPSQLHPWAIVLPDGPTVLSSRKLGLVLKLCSTIWNMFACLHCSWCSGEVRGGDTGLPNEDAQMCLLKVLLR